MSQSQVVRLVPRKEWIGDDESQTCMHCDETFTCMLRRRHHCRYCGFLLCFECVPPPRLYGQLCCRRCQEKSNTEERSSKYLKNSPVLKSVKRLSPHVQRSGTHSRSPLANSPIIRKMSNNLEKLYGSSSNSSSKNKKAKERKQPEPKVIAPKQTDGVVVIVDPFSTGAIFVAELNRRGYRVLRVFSAQFPQHIINLTLDGISMEFCGTVQHSGDLATTVQEILALNLRIVGVNPGCETGVELSDAICEALGCRGNGTQLSDARRNKYRMGQTVQNAGVRAVEQVRGCSWLEIQAFFKKTNYQDGDPCIIKPTESAGSDGVYLCRSKKEVHEKYNLIIGNENLLGNVNSEVVVQEYLAGTEYVVDSVSYKGKHKCVCIWQYDKRPANGRDFIYHAMKLRSGQDSLEQSLISYAHKVLDALQVSNGPSHAEIMMTRTGPCLVEVGSRLHGGEGSWTGLVTRCIGYTQVDGACNALLADEDREALEAWEDLPAQPTLQEFGAEVFLVSKIDGILREMPRLEEIKLMPQFFGLAMMVHPGERVQKTIDCISRPGSIRVVCEDDPTLQATILRIRAIENDVRIGSDGTRQGFYVVA